MRQGIHHQEVLTHQALQALNDGAGDAEAVRALAITLAHNYLEALKTINRIEMVPAKRIFDMADRGRPFTGVSYSDVHSEVSALCGTLRRFVPP